MRGDTALAGDQLGELLDATDDYMRARESLSHVMREGFFALAQARYASFGVSPLQKYYQDQFQVQGWPGQPALVHCNFEGSCRLKNGP